MPLLPHVARRLFPTLVSRLLAYASDAGIALELGETYRTPEQAAWNAARGTGIARSLHTERLAIDLLVFQLERGIWAYVTNGSHPDYRLLGAKWKTLHADCAWGGDFSRPDAGHFSLRIDERA